MIVTFKHLINGQWSDGDGPRFKVRNPTDSNVVVASGSLASAEQCSAATAAARHALPGWAAAPMHERAAKLLRAAAIIDAHTQEWGAELTREEGKPLRESIGEVRRAAEIFRYCAGAADRDAGTVYSSPRPGEQILVTRRPVGVVAAITPFNFPIAIPAWKIAPALVYGNTVVWKPAVTVPILAMRLAAALHESGAPAGVVNLLIADNSVGSDLVADPRIDAITFTGSTAVGRAIASTAAARGVAVQAEMSGKNAAIVAADAELHLAVDQVVSGAFRSAGQKCTATSRLVLHEAIADEFLALLSQRVTALVVGDPSDPNVDVGPLIDSAAVARVERATADALARGARTVAEGAPGPSTGHFFPPTVLEVHAADGIWRDELFGPVLAVRRASSIDEGFALANEGDYGLSVALFTKDLSTTLRATAELETGVVHINSESAGADPHVPFGGIRGSGYGPGEQGEAAREFFTHTCTTYLRGTSL